ncbi:MAG TPA: prepilin-type N-terminal cleavage/methylation domain-containing protein [Rariglobus sp.]|jgi:type II secretory pathway pseudopilin PulG|nr:prepilin-type N-terminal cleavage/methylation domain-containing protein [Rariglobus sp.]
MNRLLVTLSPAKRRQAGFTIIELLVAVGITALLVTLMLTIVTNVLNGWNRSSGSLSSGNQARLILNQLSQDIQGAILKSDTTNTWLVATIQQDQAGVGDSGMNDTTLAGSWNGVVKPGKTGGESLGGSFIVDKSQARDTSTILGLENYRFGQAGVWLRLFSVPPAANNSASLSTTSAPRAISYQLIRTRVGGNTSSQYSYRLFRSEARPADDAGGANSTFAVGYDLLMTEGSTISYNNSAQTTDSATADQNVNSIRRPNARRLLANNVIDFGVRIYGKDSSGNLIELFPVPRDANGVAKGTIPAAGNVPYTYAATGRTDLGTASLSVTGVGSAGRLFPYYFTNTLWTGTSGINAYPVAIDVMVRILTDEGARLIASIEAGNIQPPAGVTAAYFWWQTALANSQVYTRRIQVRSSPL